jgi:NhaP-type Na+/H+ and K+/H+ antiporter
MKMWDYGIMKLSCDTQSPHPVPLALKWAVAISVVVPTIVLTIAFFAAAALGGAWSSSHLETDPVFVGVGVGLLVFIVLGALASLIVAGVRGIRPMYVAILVALAYPFAFHLEGWGILWLLTCAVLLYSPSVTAFLRSRNRRDGGRKNGKKGVC